MSGNSDERALRKATEEARDDRRSEEPDWATLEKKLFARIDSDRAHETSLARFAGSRSAWGLAASGLALAAAIAMFVGRPATRALEWSAETETATPLAAGTLALRRGVGDVRVAGSALGAGQSVRAGDVIETHGATAFFERAHAVTWELEDLSQVTVKRAGSTLVLGLDRGAIEAQVTPVATGEAFAVDVSAGGPDGAGSSPGTVTRIAVHGTHLRVARVGATRVLIDLTEGVVSIGAPPRSGSTYGALVMAPAHVELDVTAPLASLQITHLEAAVRAPLDLSLAILGPGTRGPTARKGPYDARDPGLQIPPDSLKGSPSPTSPLPLGHVPPSSAAAPKPFMPPPAVQEADPHAEDTVAAAVRACAAGRPRADATSVKVTVSSRLELRVNPDGFVEFARFDPPLVPEVQTCASTSIYKTRFVRSGTITIPLVIE